MKKPGRNDPCFCGSGKKFKKCCEQTTRSGRFTASKIDPQSAPQIQRTAGLTSLFQSQLTSTPVKPTSPPEDRGNAPDPKSPT